MKNARYIAVLGIICMLSACKKDYLDKLPSSQIGETEVFSNINDAEDFVNNIYNTLPYWSYNISGNEYSISTASDEALQVWANGFIIFNQNSYNSQNFTPLSNDWDNYYNAIRECNIFLSAYNLIPEDPTYPTRKQRLKGEVYGLRAFFYFNLFRGWGALPLLSIPVNPYGDQSALYYPRSSVDSVVASITSDLDSSESLLPTDYKGTSAATAPSLTGRVDIAIDLAIKSRALLYYASPLFNSSNDKSRWTNAAAAAKQALDTALANGYTLDPSYSKVFNTYNDQEIIWGHYMSAGDIDQVTQPLGYAGWNNCGPIQEFVDAYEMQANGLPITDPKSGYDPHHPYAGRDPRFYATVLYPGEQWKGRAIDPYGQDAGQSQQIQSNYWWAKFMSPGGNLSNGTGFSPESWPIFRTGELYLNYAEAQNEASGPDATVYAAINAIRERAGMPDVPAGLSQDSMRSTIRNERRIELAFESFRFWDERRWEIAQTTENGQVHKVDYTVSGTDTTFTYPVVQTRTFTAPRNYLLPIPQDEMDKNATVNPGFTQNPGW